MLRSDQFKKLQQSHPFLSIVFAENWDTPLEEYAPQLFEKPPCSLEPELKESFEEEWCALGIQQSVIQKALTQLEKHPVLQTAHHITPTNGPTFLTLDLISTAGLTPDQIYLIAANSGVAFSNTAWTGALSYGSLSIDVLLKPGSTAHRQASKAAADRKKHGEPEQRVSLVPSRQRDQLVFGSEITRFQTDRFDQFADKLQRLLPAMIDGEPYSHWSAKACAEIQKRILKKTEILICDINRVIQRYLIKVLSKGDNHPVEQLFFSSLESDRIMTAFDQPPMFLGSYPGKKSFKVDSLTWKNSGLSSLKTGHKHFNRLDLIGALKKNMLCPGIHLLFFILRFINGIRCLGSFTQVEYLEGFRRKWEQLNTAWELDLKSDYRRMLTTGQLFSDGQKVWPLDLALTNRHLDVRDFFRTEMRQFWQPILDQLTIDDG